MLIKEEVMRCCEKYEALQKAMYRKQKSIRDLILSLPRREARMLEKIRDCRNTVAFSSKPVKEPRVRVLQKWHALLDKLLRQ